MVMAGLPLDCFIALFKENGYEIVSDKYWELEGVERVVLGKDGHTFVIRIKKYFFYPEVIKRAQMLSLTKIPDGCKEDFEACEKAYEQDLAMRKRWEDAKSESAGGKKDTGLPGK